MRRRRREQPTATTSIVAPAFTEFSDWVLSLPWVVERQYSLETPGVRYFGVDCEPLGRRQLWLVTGQQTQREAIGLCVIMPGDAAERVEAIGWGRILAPMPGLHVLVTANTDRLAGRHELEALVLTAYGCAMS
jgi:hypothetical protein